MGGLPTDKYIGLYEIIIGFIVCGRIKHGSTIDSNRSRTIRCGTILVWENHPGITGGDKNARTREWMRLAFCEENPPIRTTYNSSKYMYREYLDCTKLYLAEDWFHIITGSRAIRFV